MADQQAILKTNRGDITLNLFPDHAPQTANKAGTIASFCSEVSAGFMAAMPRVIRKARSSHTQIGVFEARCWSMFMSGPLGEWWRGALALALTIRFRPGCNQ